MQATTESGNVAEHLAFNEVSLLRQTKQAAKIRVYLNDKAKIDELVCDGVHGRDAGGHRPRTTCPRTARSCRSAATCSR